MIKFAGYKEVDYPKLVELLTQYQNALSKPDIQIAAEIDVKTPATVRNAFNQEQIVSDKVLTNIMKAVELDGFVIHYEGGKSFFISNKK